MINFNREEIQKRDHNRFYRRNIFNDLKKKKDDFNRENTIILIFYIFISVFIMFSNFRVNLNQKFKSRF